MTYSALLQLKLPNYLSCLNKINYNMKCCLHVNASDTIINNDQQYVYYWVQNGGGSIKILS